MEYAQLSDRVEINPATAGPIDTAALPGMWVNSNPFANGIARLLVSEEDGRLSVQVYAIGLDGLIDWGKADVVPFAAGPASRVGAGFTCRFEFGFAEAILQGMIMKGLLVLAEFHNFKDDSHRVPYFVREYFALAQSAEAPF
jgi:hypothetical protein